VVAHRLSGVRSESRDLELAADIRQFATAHVASARGQRHETLRLLDARGISTRDAIALAWTARGVNSYSAPRPFVLDGGETYWIKPQAQEGLGQELIGGRLASEVGVGPQVAIVDVSAIAVPLDGSLDRFVGTMLGVRHIVGVENGRELGPALRSELFTTGMLDMASWAAVTAFQTWINAEDSQVFVGLGDGIVHSADHGGCFKALLPGPPQRIVTPDIPGLESMRCDWSLLEGPAQRIASIRESVLLEAAAGMPEVGPWRTSFAQRIAIVEWLIKRQHGLPEVLRRWSTWVS
jgi:hypothetical protein